jgi:hypothetical protein
MSKLKISLLLQADITIEFFFKKRFFFIQKVVPEARYYLERSRQFPL